MGVQTPLHSHRSRFFTALKLLLLTLSLPLATIVGTVPVPLATKVDRTPPVPLAMIVAVFTNVRGIACFQIFTPQKPGTGSQKIGSEKVKYYNLSLTTRRTINSHHLRKTNHLGGRGCGSLLSTNRHNKLTLVRRSCVIAG